MLRGAQRLAWRGAVASLLLVGGCDSTSASGANQGDEPATASPRNPSSNAARVENSRDDRSGSRPPADVATPPEPAATAKTEADDPPSDSGAPEPLPPADSLRTAAHHPEAIEHRRAKRALMIYVEPEPGTTFRGKIPHGAVFELLERVEGPECKGDGWGRIGDAAFVCLRHTETTQDPAQALPTTLVDGLAPFFYARRKPKRGAAENPPAPQWRSRRAMRTGVEPEAFLEPEHDYSFVRRRRFRDGAVLVSPAHRVVREADVKRLKPSDFAGRDVQARPIPSGTVLAWSIMWPHTVVRSEPSLTATEAGTVPLHTELLVHDEPKTHRGTTFYPVGDPIEGWVNADEVRRWTSMPAPSGVGDAEVWLDIDLSQQMLALRRGQREVFVTLVSSGNYKHATPVGLFRLQSKWAWADMRSRADAADDERYHVEGVPWVQYFRGRYALHGTFWHNRFGRRTSHGCINLSAHDARWVYDRTLPAAKPGWIVINEHVREPGTQVRIRKGETSPPDRRTPLAPPA